MDEFKTIERDGLTATIWYDRDPQDPRKWEPDTTMVCFHPGYRLGDAHDFPSAESLVEFVKRKDVYALPLYLYDHSGITMSTTPFSCRWDSGQVGYIYITAAEARKRFGWKLITAKRREQLMQYLAIDVEVYDQYLTGDVYGYEIKDAAGDELDSCGGFYGSKDIEKEVERMLDYYVAALPKQFELAI